MAEHGSIKESHNTQTTVRQELSIETSEDQSSLHESQKTAGTSEEHSSMFQTQTTTGHVEKITVIIDNERDYYDTETETNDQKKTDQKQPIVTETLQLESGQATSEKYVVSTSEEESTFVMQNSVSTSEEESAFVMQNTSPEGSSDTVGLETSEREFFSKIFVANTLEGDENMEMEESVKGLLGIKKTTASSLLRTVNITSGMFFVNWVLFR